MIVKIEKDDFDLYWFSLSLSGTYDKHRSSLQLKDPVNDAIDIILELTLFLKHLERNRNV